VLLPSGHPLAERRRLRIEDLCDESWIIGSATSTCPDSVILLRACAGAGFEPRIVFNSDDYLAIQGFVAAGMGVSLIPDLALLALRDDVVVRALRTRPPARYIVAATLAGGYCSPAKTAMLEILQDVGREFEAKRQTLALAV
jgi:DNA-binding transcriptional LysR family regulator